MERGWRREGEDGAEDVGVSERAVEKHGAWLEGGFCSWTAVWDGGSRRRGVCEGRGWACVELTKAGCGGGGGIEDMLGVWLESIGQFGVLMRSVFDVKVVTSLGSSL
jgi:hypothetical protein